MADTRTALTPDPANEHPSYALRRALAERLASHRAMARETGLSLVSTLPPPPAMNDPTAGKAAG